VIKIHHKYFGILLFSFLFVKGFSQSDSLAVSKNKGLVSIDSSKSYFSDGFKTTFHQGAILPHRSEVMEVIEKSTQAIEISYSRTTFGKKKWQQIYSYPKIGVSALAINLGNPNQLGKGFGVFPFIELPIIDKRIKWNFKIGYGLGYIQKPFERENNYKNIAIGSPVNALIYANMLGGINISPKLSTSLGLSLIHFSNGSFARPNLGINILSANVGVSYSFGKSENRLSVKYEDRKRVWSKKIMFGVGLKEVPPAGGPKYWVSTYSFNMMKIRSEKSSFGFGADVFYNSSLSELITRDSVSASNNLDNFRLGILAMYSFDFGKVSVSVGMGGYVVSRYKGNGSIYNKLETRYAVNDKLFLRLAMKTHIAVADFIETGVGYNF
jgi:hypothetical protein